MKPEMTRRNALAVLGTAGLGGILAACGGNGSSDVDADNASSTSSTAADTSTNTAAAASSSSGGDISGMFEEATSCALTPEETEGPYYIDVDSIRSDIRDGRPGADLRVGIRVLDESCEPVSDAIVELWHCDALGTYSGFESQSQQANGGGDDTTSDTTRYLRGGQVTNADGIAEITTIYPGWYMGRTVHIHSKVHINNTEVLTTQLFFDDEVSDALFASTEPYSEHTGRDVTNDDDGIFLDENLLTLSEDGDGGYIGLITYNVDRG
jgi:protocatechuate 3,4-dioxygenase beta subunit